MANWAEDVETLEAPSRSEREQENVHRWNVDNFVRLGVNRDDAFLMVLAGLDWHEVDVLVARGCPVGCALEIVA